jgi:hypothetical protein
VKVILKSSKKLMSRNLQSGDADKVNLKYTDSGFIKVVLLSPKMLDFSTVDFHGIPKGIDVTLYDNKGKRRA